MQIKELRKKARLTQQQLANMAGINRATIASIESGRRNITVKTAKAIAPVLNIKWPELFN